MAQIVFRMVTDADERKDIAQEVYLKVFKNLSNFKYRSKLSTWIARISYTTCLHYLEKKKIHLFVSHGHPNVDDQDDGFTENGLTVAPEMESFIFENERAALLKGEIEKLPPLYRTLITLYHQEELGYSEIVQITELPEGTVKNYLFRARKVLKENLLQKFDRESL